MKAAQSPTTNGTGVTSAPVRLPHRKPPKPNLPPQPNSLLEAIIYAASDAAIDIAKVEHLIRLRKEMEAVEAEHAFNNALAAAQAQMMPVVADAVNDQLGRPHRYATYAALDKAVRPIYTAHGLAMTYATSERSTDTAVEVVGYLIGHGHSRRYSIVMPADGKGARGGDVMSRTHAAASAISYGMRYILVMAFNLAIDKDDDGNAAGKAKSSAQLKRDGVWPEMERAIRQSRTLVDLEAQWHHWRFIIKAWPTAWREQAWEAFEKRKVELGDAMGRLKASVAAMDDGWSERISDALSQDQHDQRRHRQRGSQ
jgi:hypothetical protein